MCWPEVEFSPVCSVCFQEWQLEVDNGEVEVAVDDADLFLDDAMPALGQPQLGVSCCRTHASLASLLAPTAILYLMCQLWDFVKYARNT